MEDQYLWDVLLISSSGITILGMIYLISIVWSFNDAKKRGVNGLFLALLIAILAWPLSLIGWLVFRPAKKDYAEMLKETSLKF